MLFTIDHMFQLLTLLGIETDQPTHRKDLLYIVLAHNRIKSEGRVVIHYFLSFYTFCLIGVVLFEQLIRRTAFILR